MSNSLESLKTTTICLCFSLPARPLCQYFLLRKRFTEGLLVSKMFVVLPYILKLPKQPEIINCQLEERLFVQISKSFSKILVSAHDFILEIDYSQTSLIRTPKELNKVSVLKRCPYQRRHYDDVTLKPPSYCQSIFNYCICNYNLM